MAYICKQCGRISQDQEECCGEEMVNEEPQDEENLDDDYNLAKYEEDDD